MNGSELILDPQILDVSGTKNSRGIGSPRLNIYEEPHSPFTIKQSPFLVANGGFTGRFTASNIDLH